MSCLEEAVFATLAESSCPLFVADIEESLEWQYDADEIEAALDKLGEEGLAWFYRGEWECSPLGLEQCG